MHHMTAQNIAKLFYNAARRRFEAVVEFFTPGLAVPLRVPVRVYARPDMDHPDLTRAILREARRRGIEMRR